MVIKIRCTDAIGGLILRFFALMGTVASDFKPEDLQFETMHDSQDRLTGGGARTKYWAKLPTNDDGTFDLERTKAIVKENLHSLGATTVNGIIYQDIVDLTLKGEIATEPKLRAQRMMKAGSSQRAVQQLFHNGLIDRGAIDFTGGAASN